MNIIPFTLFHMFLHFENHYSRFVLNIVITLLHSYHLIIRFTF